MPPFEAEQKQVRLVSHLVLVTGANCGTHQARTRGTPSATLDIVALLLSLLLSRPEQRELLLFGQASRALRPIPQIYGAALAFR
jgi:hypothetical protein